MSERSQLHEPRGSDLPVMLSTWQHLAACKLALIGQNRGSRRQLLTISFTNSRASNGASGQSSLGSKALEGQANGPWSRSRMHSEVRWSFRWTTSSFETWSLNLDELVLLVVGGQGALVGGLDEPVIPEALKSSFRFSAPDVMPSIVGAGTFLSGTEG